MPTTPRLGAPELEQAQALPETTVNEITRYVEQGAGFFIVLDKDLSAPPGGAADADAFIVGAAATGAWTGHEGEIAFRMNTGWLYIEPIEGMHADVNDEDATYRFSAGAWALAGAGGYTDEEARDAVAAALVAGGGIDIVVDDGGDTITISAKGAAVSSQSGTSYTAVLGDANTYIQFTNGAAVAFTIPPNSGVAFPIGTVLIVEQNGAGAVTFTAGVGVTLHSRGALVATAGQYAVAQVKKVATNTWTIIGDVA